MAAPAVRARESAPQVTLAQRLEHLRAASAAILVGASQTASQTGSKTATPTISPDHRLDRAKVHEWIGVEGIEGAPKGGHWSPPLLMLIEMARREMTTDQDRVIWIGERVWPYPAALVASGIALERTLFVRARCAAERLWAIDLALRSRVGVVVADGSHLDLSATRRLQLAAEAGTGGRGGRGGPGREGQSMCLLARPAWERTELSAASTRWLVRDTPSSSMNRRWTVELLRCKGLRPAPGGATARAWVVERDRATRSVRVVADVLDRPGDAAAVETAATRPANRPARRTG